MKYEDVKFALLANKLKQFKKKKKTPTPIRRGSAPPSGAQ